jgi:hypothetical protein
MNEIALYVKNLPDTMEDLSRYLFFGREKYNAVRAEIRAMEKLKLVDEVRNQKREEAQMLAETILDIEVKLGELFKAIKPRSGGDRGNQYTGGKSNTDVTFGKYASETKEEKLKDLGFNKMQAHRLETLAENADLVEQIKAEARENNDFPSRKQVLERAKFRLMKKNENTDRNGDEYESEENSTEPIWVINTEDYQAQQEKELKEYEAFMDLRVKVFKELTKIIELIADFEITPYRMDALIDNFDSVLQPDNQIRYISDSIDKLNKIKSELWKGYRYEKRKQI